MKGEGSSRGYLKITGKTLQGRMLVKEGRSQIQLVSLIHVSCKSREGDRIKAILCEFCLGIDLLNPDFEHARNHVFKGLTQFVHRDSVRFLPISTARVGSALNR